MKAQILKRNVMTKAKVGKNCKLNHCIVDENVEIDDNMFFEGMMPTTLY